MIPTEWGGAVEWENCWARRMQASFWFFIPEFLMMFSIEHWNNKRRHNYTFAEDIIIVHWGKALMWQTGSISFNPTWGDRGKHVNLTF